MPLQLNITGVALDQSECRTIRAANDALRDPSATLEYAQCVADSICRIARDLGGKVVCEWIPDAPPAPATTPAPPAPPAPGPPQAGPTNGTPVPPVPDGPGVKSLLARIPPASNDYPGEATISGPRLPGNVLDQAWACLSILLQPASMRNLARVVDESFRPGISCGQQLLAHFADAMLSVIRIAVREGRTLTISPPGVTPSNKESRP